MRRVLTPAACTATAVALAGATVACGATAGRAAPARRAPVATEASGAVTAATEARGAVTVVARGLDNPRGLAFVGGRLYVAEAGHGGSDCVKTDSDPLCFGRTGALAVIAGGRAKPILTGLISESYIGQGLAAEGIDFVAGGGPSGLRILFNESYDGRDASFLAGERITAGDDAAARDLGRLEAVSGGRTSTIADIGDQDLAWTAAHRRVDPASFPAANPNAITTVGGRTYVADSASNTLDAIDPRGRVQQIAYIPSANSGDSVPTCVAGGPDGALYVGELAPDARPGGGSVYRYDLRTGRLSVWARGLTAVDGCGFDRSGAFYAVELEARGFHLSPNADGHGEIVRIAPGGHRTVLGAGRLFWPQGFATDASGAIYVSNFSIYTARPKAGMPTGEIVRVRP